MLLAFAGFFLFLSIHPFTTYPLTLMVWRRLAGSARRRRPGHGEPSFAICVPAYNEEDGIVDKVENLLALQKTVADCQLLIYVDAATDRTVALLEPFRDRVDIVVGDARHGKSYGLNLLVKRAEADVLVFTDANVLMHEDALRRIGAWFMNPAVGCVCGHLKYQNGADSPTAAAGDLYWRIEERIRQLESDTTGIVGADGSLFATRRSLHPHVPSDIIDDFFVSLKILLAGHAVVRAPDAWAFERTGTDTRQEFGRKVRIACQAFNVHRLLWSEIRRAPPGIVYAYVSHRLLKWLIIYDLAAAGMLAFAWLCQVLPPAVAPSMALAAAAIGTLSYRLDVWPARRIASMLAAFAGAGLGLLRSISGERFQTWSPMSTARARPGVPR